MQGCRAVGLLRSRAAVKPGRRAAVRPRCGSAAAKLKLGIHCIGGRRRRRYGSGGRRRPSFRWRQRRRSSFAAAGRGRARGRRGRGHGRARGRGREGPPLLRGRKGPWARGRHRLRRVLRRARRDRIRCDRYPRALLGEKASKPKNRRGLPGDESLEPRSAKPLTQKSVVLLQITSGPQKLRPASPVVMIRTPKFSVVPRCDSTKEQSNAAENA